MGSADTAPPAARGVERNARSNGFRRGERIVLLFAAIIFLTSLISPPRLMDDVDAVQAQIARNMIQSGDWVTAHLDGVKYLEKSPLKYWMIATCFEIFGPHDWAARIPISLSAILLCWLVARMAGWAMGPKAGLYSGLSLATCLGLWLFTRVLIPDVVLTLSIAWAMWACFRSLEGDEPRWRLWALSSWAAIGVGMLLKGLIAALFPLGTAFLYLIFSGLWRRRETWRRLSILPGIGVMLLIAAPWHIIATLRNPPYFDFTMHSEPGSYRGFFWFYFFNEHILRFLNLRYPRDYDTVPRPLFWLLHFAWFFPWSAFFFRAVKLRYLDRDRASRMRLLALCWIGMVMGFFALSTTQEYYSMPAYPAFAMLIGGAMAESGERAWNWSIRAVGAIAAAGFLAIAGLLWASWSYPTPGDISQALSQNPGAYTLSLGHMGDLTLKSFAYLRLPLAVAGLATLAGAIGAWAFKGQRAAIALAVMMVLFYQAARLALIAFDPYLGSYPLAQALNRAPQGGLIINDPYYEMSGIFFYTDRTALILNGRKNNLEYGSYAPDAPHVFIGDAGFVERWKSADRWYVASEDEKVRHLQDLVGTEALHAVASAGGKTVYVNH
ncbi:MAG TPA: glycosyltransferase family 39 protein [Bryobacteraceae bacterium]|nr:glycosyltransferase family 39 protein [Bryobacteraceae bacterium]